MVRAAAICERQHSAGMQRERLPWSTSSRLSVQADHIPHGQRLDVHLACSNVVARRDRLVREVC